MKKIQYLSYITFSVWFLVSVVTIGSIYRSMIGWVINLVMGTAFALFAFYILFREWRLVKFLSEFRNSRSDDSKSAKRVIKFEMVSLLFLLVLGLGTLYAIFERVFIEGFAVFG